MDYTPLLASLATILESRLAFREAALIESLQNLMGHATQTGQSGRIGIALAQVYEQEARSRAEMVTNELRQARLSWSPKQIVDAQHALRAQISDLFKANLSQAAYLAEQIGRLQQMRGSASFVPVVNSFLDYSDKASKTAVSMVDAVINEIVAAATNDMAARDTADRPSYIYQNTFHGPIASVAQGTASVGSVRQSVGSPTPQEIADAITALVNSLSSIGQDSAEVAQAQIELEKSEKEFRSGRVAPMARIMRALDTVSKIENLATLAPNAMHRLQEIGSMLGLT